MRTVLTYGTYDLFHVGHLNLLERARAMGDRLLVGVSTDEFNSLKGKRSFFSYEDRSRIVAGLRCVDGVIPERGWEQKREDIRAHGVSLFVMGDDWAGKFDDLRSECEVAYLARTDGVSSTGIRQSLARIDPAALAMLREALDAASQIVGAIR